ncbi:MAG: hypothetical protein AB1324_06200 [Candidatus Micrarchaeota archaeon]
MADCFLCRTSADTRRVFMGSARGYSDLCFDCVLRFYKIQVER